MKLRRDSFQTGLIALMALSMSGCQEAGVIEVGILKDWFWSRFGWSVLISAVFGVVAAKFYCRLPIKAPMLDCINAARIRFLWWVLILALIITPISLWFDAWLTQPFGQGTELDIWTILSIVILNWRTLGLMFMVALVFYFVVAVCTRYIFARTCSCKYAFLPKFGH